jgi:two-component system CheB/CheR fusion protein
MNEELQSANDELQTTNEQLRARTLEISDLNGFMQSILGSLQAAVVVVDRNLIVQVWTRRAHELWGLRSDETLGQYLMNLDSGLPTGDLLPWLRAVVTGQEPAVVGQQLQAVNRGGRVVHLRVSITALQSDGDEPGGALILLEELPEAAGSDGSAS